MKGSWTRLLGAAALALLLSGALASSGTGAVRRQLASVITVNTTSDAAPSGSECSGADGDCSLRQAIDKAQSGDTIQLSGTPDSPAVYELTLGLSLLISKNLTITGNGPDATMIDGLSNLGGTFDQPYRIMKVSAGMTVNVTDLTFENGVDGNDENFTNCGGPCETLDGNGGGALFNDGGDVTLFQVAFSNNYGSATPLGGAIANSGTLGMTDVSFTGDGAAFGGGLFNHSGTVTGVAVTFENDGRFDFDGGAVYVAGGSVGFEDTTVVGSGTASTFGGGIDNAGGTVILANDTLSGNIRGSLETDVGATTEVVNTIIGAGFSDGGVNYSCVAAGHSTNAGTTTANAVTTDLGNNIDEDGHCNLTQTGDISNVDAKLVPIADNGGPMRTQALLAGSPAIDAADDGQCSAVDERGTLRPQGAQCDIGAFEAVKIGQPTASTGAATNIQIAQADLHATINLDGESGGFHFVWGTAADALTNSTDEAAAGVVSSDTTESETLTNLNPGTTYYYEAVADNASGSVTAAGPPQSFTTAAGPPEVLNPTIASVTDTTATIDFVIDPNGGDTTYVVKYGPDSNYGTQTQSVDIGGAPGPQQLSADLTGLTPGTEYHFDVVASNSVQQNVDSGDQTFSTDKQIIGTTGSPASLGDAGTAYQCPSAPSIDWGDGSAPSQGKVSCQAGAEDATDYTVTATHTYKTAGHFHVQITYSDLDITVDQYAQIAAAKIQCIVPKVKGKPLARAKSAITAAHCAVGHVTQAASKKLPKGDVLSQAPAAGKHEKKGSKVNLVVSRGKH